MYLSRGLRHGPRRPVARLVASVSAAPKRGIVTDADVDKARKYCVEQLRSVLVSGLSYPLMSLT